MPEALAGNFAGSIPFQLFAPRIVLGEFEPSPGAIWSTLRRQCLSVANARSVETAITNLVVEIFRHVIVIGDLEDAVATLINRYRRTHVDLSSSSNRARLAPCSKC